MRVGWIGDWRRTDVRYEGMVGTRGMNERPTLVVVGWGRPERTAELQLGGRGVVVGGAGRGGRRRGRGERATVGDGCRDFS